MREDYIEEEIIRVKLVKCSDEWYWYKKRVGEEFEVYNTNHNSYRVASNDILYIVKEDCEVITAPRYLEEEDYEQTQIVVDGDKNCRNCVWNGTRKHKCCNCESYSNWEEKVENKKLFNGKVKCVKDAGVTRGIYQGEVYEVENGSLNVIWTDECGELQVDVYMRGIESVDDLNNSSKHDWVEVEKEEEKSDPTNPDHYKNGIEPIDYMKSKMSREAYEGFILGNAIKYLSRYKHKNGLEDVKKARWYVERLISEMEE